MLPNLVHKESVPKLLEDKSVLTVCGTRPFIDVHTDDDIDIGCFCIDKLNKYRIIYVPIMLIDDSVLIDDVTNNSVILGFRAPSAAV